MTFTTTRRTALTAGLTLALSRARPGYAAQTGGADAAEELAWLPTLPDDQSEWPVSILTHADQARYWQIKGVDRPRSIDDGSSELWIEVTGHLPLNEGIMAPYLAEDWTDMVGFSLWDADQVTVANDVPDLIRLYRGSFDPELIADRLGAAGYQAEPTGDFTMLSNPTDGFSLSTDLGRFTRGNFNHVAASGERVIASRSRKALEAALATGSGDAPSLAESDAFIDLNGVLSEMTGYIVLKGTVLGGWDLDLLAPPGQESIPPARLFVGGIVVSEDAERVVFLLDLEDPEAAEAATAVVAERIETGASFGRDVPYVELLGDYEVDVAPDTGMLRVTLTSPEAAMRWQQFIYRFDLGFLATE